MLITGLAAGAVGMSWVDSFSPPADRYALAALLVTYPTFLLALAALVAAVVAAFYGYRQLKLLLQQQQDLADQVSGRWLVIGFDQEFAARVATAFDQMRCWKPRRDPRFFTPQFAILASQ